MGKHSPQMKRAQRKRQKLRRKKMFTNNSSNTAQTHSPSPSTDSPPVDDYSTDSPSGIYNTNSKEADHEELGVDLDVVQMEIENPYQEHFSSEYLLSCRRKLMIKVNAYRQDVERLKTQQAEATLKHKTQIDRIRSFYKTIAYSTTRTGRIVKSSMEKSSAAASIMKELDSVN